MSNLVDHAKRELTTIKEDPEFSAKLIQMVEIFADMGHSGGSAAIAISQLNALLQFQNLSPLTDDPEEWQFHGEDVLGSEGGVWQNRRNGEAFSHDGGKTYYLLSEGGNDQNRHPLHTSRNHKEI